MVSSNDEFSSSEAMQLLSTLVLRPEETGAWQPSGAFLTQCVGLSRERFDELVSLAGANHVIVRGLRVFLGIVRGAHDGQRTEWASAALNREEQRIQTTLSFMGEICAAFEQQGLDITVIKSLDHWPDQGSDLDLYTNAAPPQVIGLLKSEFLAKVAPRSWGDRLACKWNFVIPGLPEPVEIHIGRLGQTGEQVEFAAAIPRRSRAMEVAGRRYRVPSPTDRLIISTLQRMYRHFYFRLCDMTDSVALVESGSMDFADLEATARAAGIWRGVATYLKIVSDYVKRYRGRGLRLPESVTVAARFGAERVYYGQGFLRIPLLPHSASLYSSQLTGLLRRRELNNSARLGLLPWLATAAVVGQKITGSDKGIW